MAAVMYKGESPQPFQTLRYHLGTLQEHSTYEGEAVGLLLAIWLLIAHGGRHVGNDDISIFVDNQSVIQTLIGTEVGPGQYLFDEIHKLASKLKERGARPTKFTVKWISAHSNVPGNEKVDEEAKEAAKGKSTTPLWLPHLLRKRLPTSSSALGQRRKAQVKERWTVHWEKSPQKANLAFLGAKPPFNDFRRMSTQLNRLQTSTTIQLRTGHFPLNDYLYKRKLAPTDLCRKCNLRRRETIDHVTKECPAYKEPRRALQRILKRDIANPRKALTDPTKAKAIVTFMGTAKLGLPRHRQTEP